MMASPTQTPPQPARVETRCLIGVALMSADADRLAAFYREVFGVALERRDHGDGRVHHVGCIEQVHFEIKATHTDGRPTPDAVSGVGGGSHSSIELSLEVSDCDAAIERAVAAGARVHAAAAEFTWGRFGVVLDPDGNRIGLYTPPEPPSFGPLDTEEGTTA